ncbi:MAG: hypothetical protein K2X66_12295 [Cyanobacteria bacterium]|nr:hypothetical protein [Cyanobacteriota bacterium]
MDNSLGNIFGENNLRASQTLAPSPFVQVASELGSEKMPFVAFIGKRKGYVQLATSSQIEQFQKLPESLFVAAQAWASTLEGGSFPENHAILERALKIYWFILSDVVPHLHIHLYPRWGEEEAKGINLFQERDNPKHFYPWTSSLRDALTSWSKAHHILVHDVSS